MVAPVPFPKYGYSPVPMPNYNNFDTATRIFN